MLEMIAFIGGCLLLIIGYFTYGRWIEKIIKPDNREVPSQKYADGVDFIPLPHWKNMLIQLLNIAGIGPVIGVIAGIKFGPIAFLIIPIGNVVGGAVHDYLAGMMSARHRGSNLPKLIRIMLGPHIGKIFSLVTIVALMLVVAVFVNVPASIICGLLCENYANCFVYIVGAILLYYTIATLFPIDQIIGRIYPIFGAILILGTLTLFGALMVDYVQNPNILTPTPEFIANQFDFPIIPMLFVTIACGIISGFHATQAPIVARTQNNEHEGRQLYYGMMILEGIIGMIWAAVGLAIYNYQPELMSLAPMKALTAATEYFLGEWVSLVVVVGVIVLAITSGDTAMRSLRLTLAEMCHISQTKIKNRLLVIAPLLLLAIGLLIWSNQSPKSFAHLWNYFAWTNQILAVFTLFAAAVWLFRLRRLGWVALLPGMFMCFIVTTFILWTSPEVKGPYGFGLHLHIAYMIAGIVTLIIGERVYAHGNSHPIPKRQK